MLKSGSIRLKKRIRIHIKHHHSAIPLKRQCHEIFRNFFISFNVTIFFCDQLNLFIFAVVLYFNRSEDKIINNIMKVTILKFLRGVIMIIIIRNRIKKNKNKSFWFLIANAFCFFRQEIIINLLLESAINYNY